MSRKPNAWLLTADAQTNADVKAGTTVYDCWQHDYGCSSDDSRAFCERWVSVTLDPDGGYPFFTVPKRTLSPVTHGETA